MPRLRTERHDLAGASEPRAGYPAPPRSVNNNPPVDAYDEHARMRALARIDLLDRERRADRIDEAQYRVGREIEQVLELMARIGGGGQWLEGDRVDGATSAGLQAMLGFDRAVVVNAFLGWMLRHLGLADTRLLWLVLGRGFPLSAAATSFGRQGKRGQHYTADRFRDALGVLAQAKAAKGRAVR